MITSRLPAIAGSALLTGALAVWAPLAQAADVIYVTNQEGGVSVLDPAQLGAGKTIDLEGAIPRGLAVTPDGKFLLTANQKTSDVAVIDTTTHKIVRRIPIGKNPEFMRIIPGGRLAFVTFEPSSDGKPPAPGAKDDDDDDDKTPGQVAIIDLKTWKVVRSVVGAPETEGLEFLPDGRHFVITNEGNDTVTVHNIATGKLVKKVDLKPHGSRPRGIKLSPDGKQYVVTMEHSDSFVVLDSKFKFVKAVPTSVGPYGVAFDKAGKRIVVASGRGAKVQFFDATTHAMLAEVPVGKRCWHFTFTPDESKLLVACGRSNSVEVIDASTYKLTQTLADFKLPWGIVSYPKASGSLDVP